MNDTQLDKFHGLISGFSTVMLTTMAEPAGGATLPMPVARVDEHTDLWLFTCRDSAKVLEIEADSRVGVHGQNGGTSCVVIAGRATVLDDRAMIRGIWKPSCKAWFPDGADDPNLVLLHVRGEQAEYWDNTGANNLRYVYQPLTTLLTGTPPETKEGEQHRDVTLAKRARRTGHSFKPKAPLRDSLMNDETQSTPKVRTGQGSTRLARSDFEHRYRAQFVDPAFEAAQPEVERITAIAWEAYADSRKSPHTRKAGPGFADPEHELSVEWLETRAAIQEAQRRFEGRDGKSRILLISASPRTDETCPSEMAKTFRVTTHLRECIEKESGFDVDFLDLSQINSEYGRHIHPCKACVSTAMPLCHWPCSCYPNHYMGQIHDWMNELYPRWVAAHGVMIVTPVHWYQAPSVLKLMMDRLVCADGGNPDPTSTHGKEAAEAKEIELKGWDFPRHLKGRLFSIITHGDSTGSESLRRNLHDWLTDMELVSAGTAAVLDRYIGYYEPYATSHEALDRDTAFMEEARNAALTLMEAVTEMRKGHQPPGNNLEPPRQK